MARKKELELLHLAYRAGVDGRYLVSISRLSDMLNVQNVNELLNKLCEKKLIEVLYTDRHGEPFVYLTLTHKGVEAVVGRKNKTRAIAVKVFLASISAFITFILGKILYFIFK